MIGLPGSFKGFDYGIEVEKVKQSLGIDKPNCDMTDIEIRQVVRQFGLSQADTTFDEKGEAVFGYAGYTAMLTVTLYYFPQYYEKKGLIQFQ
jgi:hypothetical protein